MTEAILFIVCFGLVMFIGIRETKLREDRESHATWLSEIRECMHGIECEFSRKCEKIVTDEFSNGCVSGNYGKRISELQNEYANSLFDKIVARMGKYSVKSVPEYLQREYERNISDIAHTFHNFGNFISEQYSKKGAYHWKMTY